MTQNIIPVSGIKKTNFVGLIYGKPGVGKTTLLASIPKAVFVGTERNDFVNCLRHPSGPAKNYAEFLSHFSWASKLSNDVCDTIVVDTISEVEMLMIATFLKGGNLNTAMGGYGAGREELKKMYSQFFRDYVSQARETKNVIFIARLIKADETDEETGNTYTRTYPQIEKNKSYEMFAGEMDFIFSLKPVAPDKTGSLRTEGVNIYTRPSAGSEAKNRFNLPSYYFWARDNKGGENSVFPQIVGDINNFFGVEKTPKKKPAPVKKETIKKVVKQTEPEPSPEPEEPQIEEEALPLHKLCYELNKKVCMKFPRTRRYDLKQFEGLGEEKLKNFKNYYESRLKQ